MGMSSGGGGGGGVGVSATVEQKKVRLETSSGQGSVVTVRLVLQRAAAETCRRHAEETGHAILSHPCSEVCAHLVTLELLRRAHIENRGFLRTSKH